MKILMIMGEGHGGMFQYGALLSNALSQTVNVTAIVPKGASINFFSDKVKLIEVPMGDTIPNFIRYGFKILNLLNKTLNIIQNQKPDLVHFHNPYNPWTTLILPQLHAFTKIVTTIPEGELHQGMQKRLEMKISRNIHCKFSDALIALTHADKLMIEKYTKKKDIFIIPHGINNLFNTKSNEKIKSDSLLFFGGINPFKGINYLLKAFPLVKKQVPDIKLIIAGRGDLSKYDDLINDSKDIIIKNFFIPQDDVSYYFQRAKIVVLPYVEVDHSGIIPVAYSLGKPVVASDKVVDAVHHGVTGLVVPSHDHVALANALIKMLKDDKLRNKFGKNAYEYVTSEYSWDAISKKTMDVYDWTLNNNKN